jgi:hypothetical protein
MKRVRVPGLIDVIKVKAPTEIRELSRNPRVDRCFESFQPLLNGLLVRHVLMALSFRGG